jgi:hypothetical protein
MRNAPMTLPAAMGGQVIVRQLPHRSVLVEQELIRILSTHQLAIKMSAVAWKKTLVFLSALRHKTDIRKARLFPAGMSNSLCK